MKRIYFILICFILLVSACQKFDDIALWNMANNQEERLTALEELCSQMNTNIQALHDLISASNNGDYILNVSPVLKEGIEIGYTITFAKSGTITIYHGKDGADGKDGENGENGTGTTPAIGLKQDSDGIYYWTLNNEWLLDDSGEKVKASGIDGQDGKTPKLKIENGRWFLSMDNGNTWEDVGQATGDKGQDGSGGNSIFKKIDYTTSNEYVIFTLADNTELKLPKYGQGGGSTGELSITFSETTDILIEPLIDYEITYTISGADNNTAIEAIGSHGFTTIVEANSPTSGKIIITPPIPDESTLTTTRSVIIFVSNGENIVTKGLTFQYKEKTFNITIPDVNFKTYLVENFDQNNDGEISYFEAQQVTSIECQEKNIQTLKGLHCFFNITALNCAHNNLTSLDVSKNTKLNHLTCDYNNLTSLDVSKHTKLTWLWCQENNLTSLDVSECPALTNLVCTNNNLTSLDISKNTALTSLNCGSNNLTSLDVSKHTELIALHCCSNNLTSLDVSKNTALTRLDCHENNFSASALNQIFRDLPQGQPSKSRIYINGNPGTETCDKSIARNKGWEVRTEY